MSAGDVAAWWGAVLSTLVAAWEFYRWWRSGVQLSLIANPNMVVDGGAAGMDRAPAVMLNVTNRGDVFCKLTHVVVRAFNDEVDLKCGRVAVELVLGPTLDANYPAPLEPGQPWVGLFHRDSLFNGHTAGKIVTMGVYHSMSDKPSMTRVSEPLA